MLAWPHLPALRLPVLPDIESSCQLSSILDSDQMTGSNGAPAEVRSVPPSETRAASLFLRILWVLGFLGACLINIAFDYNIAGGDGSKTIGTKSLARRIIPSAYSVGDGSLSGSSNSDVSATTTSNGSSTQNHQYHQKIAAAAAAAAAAHDADDIMDDEQIRAGAMSYLESFQRRYNERNMSRAFGMRGTGWLYKNLGLLLALKVAEADTHNPPFNANSVDEEVPPGRTVIKIYDVNDKSCDAELITIWVRVAGPEVFAGSANPIHNDRCEWEFVFDFNVSGSYFVEAKLLVFNALADFNTTKCHATANVPSDLNVAYPFRRSIDGVKFYDAVNTCCEACTRTKGCVHWSIPAQEPEHECDLYFNEEEDTGPALLLPNEDQPTDTATTARRRGRRRNRRRLNRFNSPTLNDGLLDGAATSYDKHHRRLRGFFYDAPSHGVARNESTAWYLGCGWQPFMSLDFKCITGVEDMIYGSNVTFHFQAHQNSGKNESETGIPAAPTRSCTPMDESFDVSRGRWVRWDADDPGDRCPVPFESDVNASDSGLTLQKHHGAYPLCWHYDNFTRIYPFCNEGGCKFVIYDMWRDSYLKKEGEHKLWFGRWEQYDCTYREFTDEELQRCFVVRGVESIEAKGRSIKAMIERYLNQRLEGLKFVVPGDKTIKVQLSTLSMPHVGWHETVDSFREMIQTDRHREPEEFGNITEREVGFWVSGYYVSSEREIHINAARMLQLSQVAEEMMGPKGWKMINAYDMSAAFTYDTAWMFDGLHITGPVPKMIITKLFHYLCDGFV